MTKNRFTQSVTATTAKRIAATVAATAALASGAALAFAGTASAAPQDAHKPLTICAKGSYDAYVLFPARHAASVLVKPGTCTSLDLGDSTAIEDIEVRGIVTPTNPAGATTEFHVESGQVRPSKGGTVVALGTVEHHTALFPVL
ncbi:hypothetical protein ACFWY9_02195 [Amycolatopsis sp. NPDC059027]|uniref:hypothetical protein n=1 Tax=unclassified Amycolatopsis TaxID=2618356 RepID=UPI003670B70B